VDQVEREAAPSAPVPQGVQGLDGRDVALAHALATLAIDELGGEGQRRDDLDAIRREECAVLLAGFEENGEVERSSRALRASERPRRGGEMRVQLRGPAGDVRAPSRRSPRGYRAPGPRLRASSPRCAYGAFTWQCRHVWLHTRPRPRSVPRRRREIAGKSVNEKRKWRAWRSRIPASSYLIPEGANAARLGFIPPSP
jgi:hypothetical protein